LRKNSNKKVATFINPAGFVEQHYIGLQSLEDVLMGLEDLEESVKGYVKKQGRPALILEDLTKLSKVDLSKRFLQARKIAVRLMREMEFERAAIYGPLATQILVNTMSLIAGKHDRIRVFDTRDKALRWLKVKRVD